MPRKPAGQTPQEICEELIRQAARRRARSLDLSGLGLDALPASIGRLTHLYTLNVSNNNLTTLPDWIGGLTELTSLSAGANPLAALPESMGQLEQLVGLELTRTRLTALPDSICRLTQLRTLSASVNGLAVLPERIGDLKSLEGLWITGNLLTVLPESIGRLEKLEHLQVEGNELKSLPESMGQLSALKTLVLSNNSLTKLPESLRKLKGLGQLFLHGNPALKLPPELLGPTYAEVLLNRLTPASPDLILEFYFRIKKARRPLNEAKLILVGRGGVGKTSLVNRLLHDKFKLGEAKTEGIQISPWPVRLNNEDARLHLWDFGGQEILHATHQFFLTQRSLYLLVLSGREGTEDQDADYWLRMIESFGEGSPVLIVLNKAHEHSFDVNRRALQAKYPGIRGFIRTDCADRTGIDDLREAILHEASRLENLRVAFPASWFEIKDKLSESRKNYLSFAEFQKFCQKHGETEPGAQESLAVHLHQLGVALNYKDDPRLQDTHVLNPHWVTNGIYKLLSSQLLAEQRGVLGLRDVARILEPKKYPPAMYRFLLDLMKKFELCFAFPDNDARYLVPELLDKQEPAEAADFRPEECLNFQYHYPVIPEGLLPRFIVRTHAMSEELPRWRTGVILRFEGNRALVKADPAEKKVLISVTGPVEGRRRLLAIIRSDFERIHRDIPKLDPQEMVPVPGHPEVVIPYAELLIFEANEQTELPKVVGNRVEKLQVKELLNGVNLPIHAKEHLDPFLINAPGMLGGKSSLVRTMSWVHLSQLDAPVHLFYSYSQKDEALRSRLEPHLTLLQRQGLLTTWHERMIGPGEEWKEQLSSQFERADIILLLVSADFLASDYCYDVEMTSALARHEAGTAVVIPVILRDVNWKSAPFAKLQALPKNGLAVTLWPNEDSAWRDVSEGIERKILELRKGRQRL
ncbi:COR domain-containing protein [Archangium gephyra]|uniref:COR domain-containing protein n=1 Tax=Archangium gephyra TaxID=48 RepID=UPI00064B21D3|nr:COR domain-containing protein [Archangium gephyra]